MPTYTNAPPPDPRGNSFTLIRTPANGILSALITCSDMVGCPTHWYGGRTVPCESDNCVPCSEGIPWRWHAYVSAVLSKTHRHVLIEFTAQAAEHLVIFRNAQTTLRGCHINARRAHNRHNGRVIITCKPTDLTDMRLPKEPNLIAALSIIWNLSPLAVESTRKEKDMPKLNIITPATIKIS